MRSSRLLSTILTITAVVYSTAALGMGIYMLTQDCAAYVDLGCSFGVIFGFLFIPYAAVALLALALAHLPSAGARLGGLVLAAVLSLPTLLAGCGLAALPFTTAEAMGRDSWTYFLLPVALLLGGGALLATAVVRYRVGRNGE